MDNVRKYLLKPACNIQQYENATSLMIIDFKMQLINNNLEVGVKSC